jgi:hypothetical protein
MIVSCGKAAIWQPYHDGFSTSCFTSFLSDHGC